MITKTEITMWRSSSRAHAHHTFSRTPSISKSLKQSIWERQGKTIFTEDHIAEVSNNCIGIVHRYPMAVTKMFKEAVKRCPSISIDLDIMEGQPCISGTRIPVRSVIRAVEQYGSVKKAAKCYPQLTSDQVEDALYFSQIVLELPRGLDEPAIASG